MSASREQSASERPRDSTLGGGRDPGAGPGPKSATDRAQGTAPDRTPAAAYDAVLLLGFGGPEGQDDVIPFLRNVTRGRGIPEERLETVATHYRAFGGVSPVNGQNRALRAALEAELADRGEPLPVYWGNRNWTPLLADTVRAASAAGHTRVLAITTSAYSSYSSCRQYREDIAGALETTAADGTRLDDTMRIDVVRPYWNEPGFVLPFVEGARAALARLAARGVPVDRAHVLFTTHSIPTADAARSGARDAGWGAGGAYLAQHRAVVAAVMAALGDPAAPGSPEALAGPGDLGDRGTSVADRESAPAWSLAFQSRSGPPAMPWLEPDVNDALRTLAAGGTTAVVIVPIGFISDHMEVLWDLDTEAAATATALGLAMERVATPGIHPAFVAALATLALERQHSSPREVSQIDVHEARERRSATLHGIWWGDVCPRGCCEKGAGRPAR
ncbi:MULTISPECIES: ferrochelatase [unclassified Cryobacterium]|uniref:ferrochelatase n=1 Tax=unclassified Cryobacterium TaxID=2649013 RepID=UPI002AB36506|nr:MULTISPECIES: ferrochelatase [unclassified Cryobacterium]MDY7542687.1 ferrochelatase [Cryobacterium sp. 5B3]MEB0264808.1 ferrochelatase [Cryobacterium sp. 10I5]